MGLKEECTLSMYRELAPIGDKNHVMLVQNTVNGKFYVKKTLATYHKNIYDYLKNYPCTGVPIIYEVLDFNTSLVVIEEFINGRTLEEAVTESGPYSESETADIILSLCETLNCLHRTRPPIIHRDIKASNVMITGDKSVKLVDFNIARPYSQTDTKDTVLMGTVSYAAPEQYGFAQTDARTDIYALGVLTNYLLTGTFPDVRLHQGRFTSVIKTCTHIDPEKRYQSVDELMSCLVRKPAVRLPEMTVASKLPEQKWRGLPGFRSRTPWKMHLALFCYLFLLCFLLSLKQPAVLPPDNYYNTSIILIMIAWFILVLGMIINFKGIRRFFPLATHPQKAVRYAGIYISTHLIMFHLVLLALAIMSFFTLFASP